MAPTPAPPKVQPRPELPRSIGYLNLLFGAFLFLTGLRCLEFMAPSLTTLQALTIEPEVLDRERQRVIASLDEAEKEAKTAQERASIRADRRVLESGSVEEKLDLPKINKKLRWLSYSFWVDVATGPVLNLLMLASGLGLARLMLWAYSLAVWVAVAKLVRLAVLFVLMVFVALPSASSAVDAMMRDDYGRALISRVFEKQSREQGRTPPGPMTPEMYAQSLKVSGYLMAFFYLLAGSVYPIVSLVVLLWPGARAACEEGDERSDRDEN